MYLLFLDESGKPSSGLFSVGGVAVQASEWPALRSAWKATLDDAGWPADKEIKWHGTRTGEVPPELADALFSCLAKAPITCFVCVLYPDAGRVGHPELFETPEHTYRTALTFIAERYERTLEREDSHGVIVLDSRERDSDERPRRFFDQIQQDGTQFTKLDRIVDSLLLGPSHHSIGLQVADLVVGTTMAAQAKLGDASRWTKLLQPRFATHPATGEVNGVGLKVFPDSRVGDLPATPLRSCLRFRRNPFPLVFDEEGTSRCKRQQV